MRAGGQDTAIEIATRDDTGSWGSDVLRWIGRIVGLCILLAAFGFGLMVIRLVAAPMSLDTWLPRALPPLIEMQTGDPLRVAVSHVSVQWMVFRRPGAPFSLHAEQMSARRLRAPTDEISVAHLHMEVAALPLLVARVRPTVVELSGVRASLGVDASGNPEPLSKSNHTPSHDVNHTTDDAKRSGLPKWLDQPRSVPAPWRPLIAHLHRVQIDDTTLNLTGGQTWHAAVPHLAAARERDGWSGGFELTARAGGGDNVPRLTVSAGGDSQSRWHLSVAPLTFSMWPKHLPFGARLPEGLAEVAAPVSVDAHARMGPTLLPLSADLSVIAQAGTVAGKQIDGAHLNATFRRSIPNPGDVGSLTFEVTDAGIQPRGVTPFNGHARLVTDTALHAPSIAAWVGFEPGNPEPLTLPQLVALWPPGVADGARAWISQNMPAGEIRRFALAAQLGGADFGHLEITHIAGGLDVSGAEVHWLRPIAPLTGVAGHISIDRPDVLHIAVTRGQQNDGAGHTILLRSGQIDISALTGKDQLGDISVVLAGDLGAMLHLLAHPRLHLLSHAGVDLDGAAGATDLAFRLSLPLDSGVRTEQLDVDAKAHVTGAELAHVVAGQPLDDAVIDVHATQDGMQLKARGLVAHLPSALDVAMDFRSGPPGQKLLHATLDAHADRAHVMQAVKQYRFGWLVEGQTDAPVQLGVVYDSLRGGRSTVAVRADLAPLALRLPVGWSKRAGDMARMSGTLVLDHDHVAGVDLLHIDAPGFVVRAQGGRLPGPNGTSSGVRVVTTRLEVGRSRATGDVSLPSDPRQPNVAHIVAPIIDLGPLLTQNSETQVGLDALPSGSAKPGRSHGGSPPKPWSVDARVGHLLLGAHSSLEGMYASISGLGPDVVRGRLSVRQPARVGIELVPEGAGLRVNGSVDNLGALLAGLELGGTIRKGTLSLGARTADRQFAGAIDGTLRLDDTLIGGLPDVAHAAAILSLGGLLGHAQTDGSLIVRQAVVPFHFQHGIINIAEARAHNPAIGVTMRGNVDLHRSRADLHGTVVPAWLLNHLPGRLPVVGKLFSPEVGGGVLAVTVAIAGSIDNPSVSVHPLTLLAPGILRKLFE